MIEVQLYDGTILEFPDGTPDKIVDSVAKRETMALRLTSAEAGAKARSDFTPRLTPLQIAAAPYRGGKLPETAAEEAEIERGGEAGFRQFGADMVGIPVAFVTGGRVGTSLLRNTPLFSRSIGGAKSAVGLGAATDTVSAITKGDLSELLDIVTKAPGRATIGAGLGAAAPLIEKLPGVSAAIERSPMAKAILEAIMKSGQKSLEEIKKGFK